MFHGRRKAYTEIGIRRVPCARCGRPSMYSWQACANGSRHMGVCGECDIKLNELVLRWFRFRNWRQLMKRYRNR